MLGLAKHERLYYGDMPEALLLVSRRWYHAALAVKGIWANLKGLWTHRLPSGAPRFVDKRFTLSEPVPIEVDLDDLATHLPQRLQAWHPTPVIIRAIEFVV
jgi:hypothetical protein